MGNLDRIGLSGKPGQDGRAFTGANRNQAFQPPRIRVPAHPLGFPRNIVTILRNNMELFPQQAYEQPLVVTGGPVPMAFISGADLVRTVLQTGSDDFPKARIQNELLRPIFGNAMISSEGHEWRWQRRAAAPMFRHAELLQYGPTMTEAADATVARWRTAPPGTIQAVEKDMMRTAYHVISNTILAGGGGEMADAIETGREDYFNGANWWAVYTILGLPHWLPRPGGRKMRAQEQRMRRAVRKLVQSRSANHAGESDLLARLLDAADPQSNREMPDELLVDNVVSFLVAGYDTTALAMTWALYLISQSPEWEARILDEVNRVAGSDPVGSHHVAKLDIVQQVVKETLRLYPTAPVIAREITQDIELGGTMIKAGTIGWVPIYVIHRHEKYWDRPNCFLPERFGSDREAPSNFQYLPFGAGPRICIGAAFAMIELTIVIATLVRAARFELAPDFTPEPSGQMFLLPKNGMAMKVTLRE